MLGRGDCLAHPTAAPPILKKVAVGVIAPTMVRSLYALTALMALCAPALGAEAEAPPLAEFHASDMKSNGDGATAEAEAAEAQARMSKMFQDVRRLQYSYDFDSSCVSSLLACVDDSACGADEICYFASSRKKRQLNAASEKEEAPAADAASRKLLFGSNAVGQCVCE